jgi:hypothetical protein
MTTRPTVHLNLYSVSQKPYLVSNLTLGACTYALNWDAIFNGLNRKYKFAMVRCHLTGFSNIAKDTVSNAVGYLSLVGLGSAYSYSQDIQGVIMGDLQFANSAQVSASETGYYLNMDTRGDAVAPMIPTPQGVMSTMTVLFSQEGGTIMANANLSNYSLTLIFELFDEI